MDFQLIIVAVVVAACLAYAIQRIRKALRVKAGEPCGGCALKEVCEKNKRKGCRPLPHANDAQAQWPDRARRGR